MTNRKQRLRTLENEIRSGMEEFYYTGMKLKEIRDDELYKEDGFESWEKYCRARWEWSRVYVHQLITASEYRQKLPTFATGKHEWSERSVRELTRIPEKRDAARVAAKIIKAIEQSAEEAEKDPGVRPIELTSATVRRFVDEDLGIKPRRSAARPARDNGIDLTGYIDRQTGTIEGILDALRGIQKDAWEQFSDDNPQLLKRLGTACSALVAFLRK
jgi:hypothetical protein